MRFCIIQEADSPNAEVPTPGRYKEIEQEALLAEEMGFSSYASSEQHFNRTVATISAPESLLAYLAAKTTTIRLRAASFVLLTFNHPLRVAERAATLDVLSDGRFEMGTARSNNPRTLRSFGVDPNQTRAMWEESIQIIRKALTEETMEHHGKIWDIPPTSVMPRPIQRPHPPLYVSATSIETHRNAGLYGIGAMTGNTLPGGWDYLADAMAAYQSGLDEMNVGTGALTESRGALAAVAHCAESDEKAREQAAEVSLRFVNEVVKWYDELAAVSNDYASMAGLGELMERRHDLEHLIDRSPYISVGSPDFFIRRSRKLRELGYDEFILRIDGMAHEQLMTSIELLGKHVIPVVSDW